MTEVIHISYYFVIIIALLSFLVTLSNLKFLDSLVGPRNKSNVQNISISILVPARNEEENIAQCLRALIAQKYNPIEILVLDDRSTDSTPEIIRDIAKSDDRIKILSGSELPNGWIGKNWACHQLSQEATGDFLLFIDADTILSEEVVLSAVTNSTNMNTDLLTVMPQRITNCIVEKLLFPFIDWASFCWIPMKRAHNSQNSHLSASFGQFMLFKREAYEEIGGHAAIRHIPIDDFKLGRTTKKSGLKWTLFIGANCVQVLPSKGNIDAFMSVSRSVFPAIYYKFSVLILFSVACLIVGFLPLLTVATNILTYPQEMEILILSSLSICMISIQWFVVCRKFNHGALTVLFYPLAIALMVIVGFHSMLTYTIGVPNWKRRKMVGLRK